MDAERIVEFSGEFCERVRNYQAKVGIFAAQAVGERKYFPRTKSRYVGDASASKPPLATSGGLLFSTSPPGCILSLPQPEDIGSPKRGQPIPQTTLPRRTTSADARL